ncbi:hypothetical protein SD71_13825 [Cohnella kolymensis]|uniref:Flagellar protein n=1 Tax=Cohnella kolymensis TaxID=1590652 RepID=A0ABR5A2X9_9BACL|nr:hypothetical protein [Cohnella kolymensis]KIL35389.1 hypothetical protein SD71_13825 [Cohnella kolymensis]
MSNELNVANCPRCNAIFQMNSRNLCSNCSAEDDRQLHLIESILKRNRHLTTEEVAAAASVPAERIRSWIRIGRIRLYDYPNLTDTCDMCGGPLRKGKLCASCTTKLENDIARMNEQEQLMKERLRAANNYISKK